jgi:hypothetical protein
MATPKLPLDLYSPDQLGIVMLELRDHINAMRDKAVREKETGQPEEPPHVSALLLGVMHGAGVRSEDQAAQEELQRSLQMIREKAPVAHITLAALPPRTLKRQLIEWFRTQINPYCLLTFSTRTDIGGGIVLRAGSKVYDFSFRHQIVGNKERISAIFDARLGTESNVRQ